MNDQILPVEGEQDPPKKLRKKQKVFCLEYVKDWNGARAARATGYSERTAASIASENLTKPEIKAEIKRILDEKAMSADEVLARLADQARASQMPFIEITEEGEVYFDFSSPEAKEHIHLIKKIKTKRKRLMTGRGPNAEPWEHEWVEVELHDAQAALIQIGRHHALFTDRTDLTSGGEKLDLNVWIKERQGRLKQVESMDSDGDES